MAIADIRDILFLIAPEFYTVDSTELNTVNSIISLAINRVNETRWGVKYNEGVAWLSAHLLKRRSISTTMGNTSGIITKEKLADQEITYGNITASSSDSFYTSTIYGQEFLNLKNTIQTTPILWGGNSRV